MKNKKLLPLICLLFIAGCLFAQSGEGEAYVESEKLNDHLYKISCVSDKGNVAHVIASVGDDGVLLIDAGFAATSTLLRDELEKLGGLPKYLINTHAHLDHIGGNMAFGNAQIISHIIAKKMMTTGLYILYAIPEYAIPTITFDDEYTLKFNGETIKLNYMQASHTGGDIIVHFVESDIVALGDIIFPDWYPYIDLANGGTLKNITDNIQYLIDNFTDKTKFIAGHSITYTIDDLKKYQKMLDGTTALVEQAIAEGKDCDQMIKEDLLRDWESYNDNPFNTTKKEYWIKTIYSSLTNQAVVGIPPFIGEVIDAWLENGVDDAVNKYKDMKQNYSDDYEFHEAYLNAFGYHLLRRNKIEEAIKIFRLNTEEYPESVNVFDSLGEAYCKKNNNKCAIECYEKVLTLDSENDKAKQKLKELKSE